MVGGRRMRRRGRGRGRVIVNSGLDVLDSICTHVAQSQMPSDAL